MPNWCLTNMGISYIKILNLFLILRLTFGHIQHGGIKLELNSEDCEFEISYLDIQFFCHNSERPSFYIGKGDFIAIDHLGNFDLNDTIIEKVIFFYWLWHQLCCLGSFDRIQVWFAHYYCLQLWGWCGISAFNWRKSWWGNIHS